MRILHRFFANWQNIIGLGIVTLYVFVAAAAPLLAPPEDPDNPADFRFVGPAVDHLPHEPSEDAPLGTLPGQMDVYYSLIWGTRHALRFGLVVALISGCLGILIGALSGYAGGTVNTLTLGLIDAFLAFPVLAGTYLFREIISPSTLVPYETPLFARLLDAMRMDPVMLTLILFSWMPHARIINSNVMRLKTTEYVMAAKSLGASALRIVFRHLIPNAVAPVMILVARDVGTMVLIETAFTFVGVGGGSPWGILLLIGRNFIIGPYGNPLSTWWVYVPATLALILFGVGWNLLGDGLNSVLNPYRRR